VSESIGCIYGRIRANNRPHTPDLFATAGASPKSRAEIPMSCRARLTGIGFIGALTIWPL